ncbi:hypothetical protein IMZ11_02660 [Microtetraspora sp. AC03309]|uniref:hypothetical protein n=1 Tax=Microtetraspora sp. AC03309 TaxID=2779376 RepID=UPI001E3397AC|nr:hypothetical protein [Microtetraspora sp. AC03309]MCC5574541.1 hypothetical protein [Microtetraspora sp. AC03309]
MSALGIFGGDDQFVTYRVTLRCIDKLVGGIPSDESVIKGWLKSRMEIKDRDLDELTEQTLKERFPDRQPSADELADALLESDAAPSINGFKRHPTSGELVYEGRCMKAAIKEWANSAYPGTEWPGKADVLKATSKGGEKAKGGTFRKGLMSTLVERVFVDEIYIGLGVTEPTAVEERIKHVMTPQGPRSSINRVEYVQEPELSFTLRVRDDFLPMEAWGRIWQAGEQIGIGADRGRSDGRFELLAFDRV